MKCLCAHGYGKGSTARKPVFSNLQGWKREDYEQAKREKGTCAVWQGQDQQQCPPEGNTDSSGQSAQLSNLPSDDTCEGA